MPKIFISYRREDSKWQVDRIHTALKPYVADPRADIFVDVDNIPVGVDFASFLDAKLAQCDVLLAVIGRDWLNIKSPKTGQRRLDDPKDFVRVEIASALKRGIAVAPVLLDGVRLPEEEDVPEELRPLIGRQSVNVSRESFDADVQRLINGLGLRKRAVPKAVAARPGEPRGNPASLIALAALVITAGGIGAYGFVQGWFSKTPESSNVSAPNTVPAPTLAAVATIDEAEAAAWDMADSLGSAEAYKSYVASFPRGANAAKANAAIARIADDADWTGVSGGSRAQLNGYLSAHPSGVHGIDARTQLASLYEAERTAAAAQSEVERDEIERRAAELREVERRATERRADENAWSLAKSANTTAAFRAYLDLYPNGQFVDQARRAIPVASTIPAPRASDSDSLKFSNKPTQ